MKSTPEELIPISFSKIVQSNAYTILILGTKQKKFAIYTDPLVGHNLQLYLSEEPPERPSSHNLIGSICKGFNIKIIQVVISGVEDTLYFARLFLEQEREGLKEIAEIDARPSDCISLALMYRVPILCRRDVLEQAVPIEDETP